MRADRYGSVVRLLDPKLDIVFKLLFSREQNRGLLISLLTAVLDPDEPIGHVEVQNPEIPKGATFDKGVVLDLRVRVGDQRHINVEMQSRAEPGFQKRALFYWARLYASQLKRGGEYRALLPTASIIVQDFAALPTARYHSCFKLLETRDHWPLGDEMVVHFVELPKLPQAPTSPAELPLWKWAKFLAASTRTELEKLAMNDPVFDEAKRALEQLSADPAAQELAHEREIWAWNHAMQLRYAREEGMQQGIETGRHQGERGLLRRQLELKFGDVSPATLERLDNATEGELSLWAQRILTASTPDEVFDAVPPSRS